MARPCSACSSPHKDAIARMIASGTSYTDVAAWLRGKGAPITRTALSRHAPHVGEGPRTRGPRPMSDDFLEAVRDRAYLRLAEGDIEPGIKDGIAAQSALDRRAADFQDRQLMMRIALALTATSPVLDEETAALEASFRPLLGDGRAELPRHLPRVEVRRGRD
jgi:hypothetical protein